MSKLSAEASKDLLLLQGKCCINVKMHANNDADVNNWKVNVQGALLASNMLGACTSLLPAGYFQAS